MIIIEMICGEIIENDHRHYISNFIKNLTQSEARSKTIDAYFPERSLSALAILATTFLKFSMLSLPK